MLDDDTSIYVKKFFVDEARLKTATNIFVTLFLNRTHTKLGLHSWVQTQGWDH